MIIETKLTQAVVKALQSLYNIDETVENIHFQKTKKEFEGDFTFVVFPYVKAARKSPADVAKEIGEEVCRQVEELDSFNAVQGFLNLTCKDSFWVDFLNDEGQKSEFGLAIPDTKESIVVEYSSPNTNKPLHLGHIRNNLLGWSVAEILKANGHQVKKVNLVNDRGIHICKSMLAWLRFGNGETPESTGIKGDHLVGKYYVEFDKAYKAEIEELIVQGMSKEEAEKKAPLIQEAQAMLVKWEAKDAEVVNLWKTMNGWVYKGFDETYKKLGVDFDKIYYESDTYLLGKDIVLKGLESGVLFKKEDGSVWADLSEEGLDQKLLLRADGTSVYMTQDLGTALLRHNDFGSDKLAYVVGNEQNYHFDVLKIVLKKLGYDWAEKIYHLSYGMVELPEGKMKSREGTVVDADDLIDEMIVSARESSEEHGKTDMFSAEEAEHLYYMLAMGALKYFILKVDPTKNMLFNPKESIDFNGNTGPFIQYTHARIRSIIRKASEEMGISLTESIDTKKPLLKKEKEVLRLLYDFPETVNQAAETYSPALIANYIYELAKSFNAFYQDTPILKENDAELVMFRVHLCSLVATVVKKGMRLLGIDVPERM